jgi:hypothetical protein
MIARAIALKRLEGQLGELRRLRTEDDPRDEYDDWARKTEVVLERVFGNESRYLKDFASIRYSPSIYVVGTADYVFLNHFKDGMKSADALLSSALMEVKDFWSEDPNVTIDSTVQTPAAAAARVERICQRFHLVVRQLRRRHAGRTTLDVGDEYDVQDLLHALLRVEFDDIRAEEWTPSYAGKAARVDFLLKGYSVIVETKMTRDSISDKEVGEQLIIDIQRYQSHPNCEMLICFVYDPDGRMRNPKGIENDLNRSQGRPLVRVLVIPSGV